MKQVLSDSGSLRFPVTPDAHGAMMDMIAAVNHVDGGMHLDTGNLSSSQLHHVIDMMNVVILDDGKNAPHSSNDSTLLTVMNVAASDDMAADLLLQPSVVLASANRIPLHLRGTLHMLIRKIMIIVRIQILAQADSGTLAVADFTVLDDPSL